MDQFSLAASVAGEFALVCLDAGHPPEQVAEAFLVQGLALWAAHKGRADDAEALIRHFDEVRNR